jgi:hypothetical protein
MRVAVFLRHHFHDPILRPIAERLRQQHEVLVSSGKWDLVDFNPHVFVAAESLRAFRFHYYLPFTLFVHTRHGLASKGVALESARFSHYTCLTSFDMQAWYETRRVRPRRDFWVCGYPQMDAAIADPPGSTPLPIPPGRKVVLYAPTFQFGLTSVRMLGASALDRLKGGRDDVFVLIKPHPLIAAHHPDWLENVRAQAAARDDVYLARDVDSDLMPFLRAADVLVSDGSSALLEFLAFDRPIVLVTNPDREKETFYDPSGYEWQWRDMGEEVFDADSVAPAVARALADPASNGELRRHYRARLFGDLLDGRSNDRISRRIDRLQYEIAGPRRMALARSWARLARALSGRN